MTAGWLVAHGLEPRTLDRQAVAELLPQRPPLLLVDCVFAAARPGREQPAVAAALSLRGNEPVLAGHFPGRPVWPGCYTLEGLAQTCALAGLLAPLALPPTTTLPQRRRVVQVALAGARLKWTGLITPPGRLEYFAEQISRVGELHRFAVEASIDERPVAVGTLDVAIEGSDA